MIRYSRGRSKFDAHPEIRQAPDFDAFERAVLADRARAKGLTYICAPFKANGEGKPHRGKDLVEPRRFLALDIDYIASAETFTELRLWLARFKGFGFTTASSTQDSPRCRVLLELDRDADRPEGMRVGAAIVRDVAETFGESVRFDESTHRGEQPCYAPVARSEPFRLDGDPVAVDTLLEDAPETEPERKGSAAIATGDDPVIVALKARGMYRRDLGAGRHAIRCPWESTHTSEDPETSTATAYLQPHHQGFVTPGFACKHDHCSGRHGDELLAFLGVDWREVKDAYGGRGNAPGSAAEVPAYIDDVPPIDGATPAPAQSRSPAVVVRVSPIDWAEVKRKGKQPRRWAMSEWASYDPLLFAGDGGAGKTLLAQQIGMALAVGKGLFTPIERELRGLMWACEDGRDELGNRAIDIAEHLQIDLDCIGDKFVMIPRRGLDNTLFAAPYDQPGFTALLGELEEQINDLHINVLFLDNIGQMYAGKENDRHQVTRYVNGIFGCARHDDFVPIIMGHPAKAQGSEYSGSTAWENAVRMRWYLGDRLPDEKQPEPGEELDTRVRVLAKRKSNYSAKDWRRFTFENGVLVPEQIDVGSSGVVHMLRRRKARGVLMDALRKLIGMGKTLSDAKGANYLPKLVIEYRLADGVSKPELEDAMREAQKDGEIVKAQIGQYSNRQPKFGLIEGAK